MMHEPVLLKEIIEYLEPKPGDIVIDGTANGGGHARELLHRIMPGGTFIGIEWDEKLFEALEKDFEFGERKSNIILLRGNYKDIAMILKSKGILGADKVLLDLGFSSFHIDQSDRGFSFKKDEPLIMTYSKDQKPVWEWLNKLSESKLTKIIREFGEERYAERIARSIKKSLPITTSNKLRDVVMSAIPKRFGGKNRIHPATRTFQALRIFANQELENLKLFLESIPQVLNAHGRVAIISFHSLEDRLVKSEFRGLADKGGFKIVTKKPITAGEEEVLGNPRSRSAKLRVIEKI